MSSSDLAISVRGLSKAYTIRHQEGHITLAEQLLDRARHPFRRTARETFWALDDLSFDVHQGEVLGIIGRNGAGKSTLLKILSRITPPTKGEVRLYGRVGSLLEVGTGFHPELTGRENIYLNGAILGMRTKEIDRRFDEIVEFAGVEKFLDTPVKRFSSGMYVRLAFAVAAHLETEILLVDEVLAVGDVAFQKKCLQKMTDVATGGRTVLLVSHNLHAIAKVCAKAVILAKGTASAPIDAERVVDQYLESELAREKPFGAAAPLMRSGTGEARLMSAASERPMFRCDEVKRFFFSIEAQQRKFPDCWIAVQVRNGQGLEILNCDARAVGFSFQPEGRDGIEVAMTLTRPWLKPGRYELDVYLCNEGIVDACMGAVSFEVSPTLPYPGLVSPDVVLHAAVLAEFAFDQHNTAPASERTRFEAMGARVVEESFGWRPAEGGSRLSSQ